MKSWKTPTPEVVARAVANMVRLQQQEYFFDRLENPEWLQPLREKGFFSRPPLPKHDKTQGTVEFNAWAASRYLSRMAALAPELVSSIILEMPATENPFVIRDLMRAAVSMHAETSEKLAQKIADLVRTPYLISAELAGEFAARLAGAKKSHAAITVLRSALEIVADPRPIPEEMKRFNPNYRYEARTRIRTYEYEMILQRNGPQLTSELGISFVELLSGLLERALRLENRGAIGEEKKEDYSYIWQPNLSSSGHRESAKSLLVAAVLRSADQLASIGSRNLARLHEFLSRRTYKVFERIEMELISRHLELDLDAAGEKLTSRNLFDDLGVRPEYYSLSEKAFGLLPSPQQAKILRWIETGLDKKKLEASGMTGEQAEERIEYWRFERLTPLREHLPAAWRVRYDSMQQEFGTPKRAQYPFHSSGFYAVSSRSPKNQEELENLGASELIKYLKSWDPASEQQIGPFGPSEEGLGTVLTNIVTKDPGAIIANLHELKGADPTYVRATIQGFEGALRAGKSLDWQQVIELCMWVVSQPREIPGRSGDPMRRDPDWNWTRGAIVSLIEQGFKSKTLLFSTRAEMWQLIEQLATEDDSTRLDYRNPDSLQHDVWSASINRNQPRAVRSVIAYIEWCRDNMGREGFSLQSVPEAESFLRDHLDDAADPSLDVRLIYGEFLPFLMSIDATWIASNVDRIFPNTIEKKSLRDVAWVAYLTANAAYDQAFELLNPQYSVAVDEIGTSRHVGLGHMLVEPDEKLAQHLMQLYWRGRIDLKEGGLLQKFYERAGTALSQDVITYVGRSISNTEQIPQEVLKRIESLWDYHLSRVSGSKHAPEMAAFGWWFNSNHFDDQWALEHLYMSLQFSRGEMDPKLGTLTRLAALSEKYPEQVIACTELIVNADPPDLILWEVDLKKILTSTLKSGATSAKIARKIIQDLGIRGHLQYRVLLSPELLAQ